ncbi:HAMP domain-containing sensor histidine kinase [Oceanicaulis sp. MMSF_3324]|uniref:sensor histidine kinase n=1 Tax=Oceanicaulis sp. MMSF_3324 TaxID=3046702 RepID=UPI00273F865D|nr:HAMP domain-containing sensor histidine kinase [Oceanicaulis sp. MMSF_3324]
MRAAFAPLSRFLDHQAARLIHGGWLVLVALVGTGVQTPLAQGDLGVLGLAAAPGLLGLLLGGRRSAGRDSVRFLLALAWTLPGLAAALALGSALSPAALVFLAGPAALSAAGLRKDVHLSATMNTLAFVMLAIVSAWAPLSTGSASLVTAPVSGLVLAIFFAACGFTARVQLLGALDRARADLRALAPAAHGFENAPTALMTLDRKGRIAAVSRRVRGFTPGAPRDMNGLELTGLAFDDEGRADIQSGLNSALAQGQLADSRFSFPVRSARGARQMLDAQAQATETGFVLSLETPRAEAAPAVKPDVIAELEAERDAALAASQSKSEFLAAVSHELRTPLNAIIGFSDIIKQRLFGPLPARYAEYGDLIHESGEHLLELIGDVLDMSKIEADKYELTPEEFDARDVVSICAKMINPRAKDRGIALYCEPGDADLPVKADRKALRQILLNLLSNAVKFTPEGGAVVVMARQDGAELVLAVGDSGVGIGEDELADLGKPYHQTRSGKETSERGTGLGLSLVQALAEMQGGDVRVQSARGQGTTVTVRLPVMGEAKSTVTDFALLEVHQRIAAAQQAGEVIIKANGGAA